ncbi:MAG: O-methyltransferase, partial [Gemmatimonadota bacterium]
SELRGELEERGFPLIQVPARTGRVLELLARMVNAKRVLEIGTLGGYSALWLLRGMAPGGKLVTVEKEPDRADLAGELFERAGEADRVEIRVGDARGVVAELGPDGAWDLVFIDADKEGYTGYLTQAVRLLRPGGLVVADNALWEGRVVDGNDREASTEGVRAFNRALADGDDFRATILPVGDGVALGVREG